MAEQKPNGGKSTKPRSVMVQGTAGAPSGAATQVGGVQAPPPPASGEMPKPATQMGGAQGTMPVPEAQMRTATGAAGTMPQPGMQGATSTQSTPLATMPPPPLSKAPSGFTMGAPPRPHMTGAQDVSSIMPTGMQTTAAPTRGGAMARIMETPAGDVVNKVTERATAAPPVGFDYPATLRGTTTHFAVYYDATSLPVSGPIIADAVLASCEYEYDMLQSYFDGITPGGLPMNIIIAAGIGGAYHYGCGATDLYCDGDTSSTPDVNHTRMLVVAEEVEVFEAAQGRGWDCGASNGEGLSRTLATQLYPAELDGFESASSWLNAPGRPDYVNVTDSTDRNYVSIGCATLFLNFLRHQLRFSWEEITRAAAGTLAQTYTNLTGRTDGLARFKSLVQAYYPEGTPVYPATDNLFPLPGVIELVARGSDGAVWHRTQTAPNNGWTNWSSLGGWVDLIEIAQNDDTRLEVFARGGDGAVWHNWQTSPNGSWSGWASMGGWIDRLEVAQNADGRLEIFARGGDGAVWHNWQTSPSNGWSGWYSMGGWIDMLDVARNADGRLEIFARGSDGAVWHMWQTSPNNGWSNWESLGGWVDMLEVAQNADGRLEIFARGGDKALWHMWQTSPNNGWSGWASLGGWIDMLAIGENDDGRIEVFARGSDAAVWHNWQTFPNNGWSGWASMGGWIDRLDIAHNADGRMEIFARGSDSAVWHNWQTSPSNGWSGWVSMGGWVDIVEVFPELIAQ